MPKKFFNIAGPIKPAEHYFIPNRLSVDLLLDLIDRGQYFVLHAPRQSGKTTSISELIQIINKAGVYNALYVNIETAQAMREDVKEALLAIIDSLKHEIKKKFPEEKETIAYFEEIITQKIPTTVIVLQKALSFWAAHSKKPLVLFIDEIDSLIGDSLLSVLRQIRAGYIDRPDHFPKSICLVGLRDVRDYRIWSKESGAYISAASPFNIKATSILLPNFTLEEVRNLYHQHTEATGQVFEPDSIEHAFYLTQGQPWLVNALADQCCFKEIVDRSCAITKQDIEQAKNQLIFRRDTHIDSLVDKLSEPRVIPIIDAILSGEEAARNFPPDDVQYLRDLGLVAQNSFCIANPIYKEIIPRELTWVTQGAIQKEGVFYQNPDGSLNFTALMQRFTQFFRENSEAWLHDFKYIEAGPHLLMMAFLQRIINGGGEILREYALGRKRLDLLITWKKQKIVVEIKIRHSESVLSEGLVQTKSYLDKSGANEAHLVIFDRDSKKSWEEKISSETVTFSGHKITVWTL